MKKMKFLALLLGAMVMAGCSGQIGGGEGPVGGKWFSFQVSEITSYSATVKVTASDELTTDWIWDVAEEGDRVDAAYVKSCLAEYYSYQLESLEATESEYPFNKFLLDLSLQPGVADEYSFDNMLSPNTTYKVWACGLDMDGNPVNITIFKFKTEDLANDVKGNWSFNVATSSEGVSITVTPPSDLQTVWYWDVCENDGYGVDASLVTSTLQDYLDNLVEEGYLASGATMADIVKLIAIPAKEKDSFTYGVGYLYDGDYYIWACGLDANGNVVTKIDYSEFTVSGMGSGGITGIATPEEPFSNLTANVNLAAEEAYISYGGAYWDDFAMSSLFNHESFYIELCGPYVGQEYEWMILDLLAPAGATGPEGTYTVGYSGDYIALSSVYVDCGDSYLYGGSCYGFGFDEEDPYADFESGTVKITKSGSNYNIVVDAKCGSHTIKATYTGALLSYSESYSQAPKLKKYCTAPAHRTTLGRLRKVNR